MKKSFLQNKVLLYCWAYPRSGAANTLATHHHQFHRRFGFGYPWAHLLCVKANCGMMESPSKSLYYIQERARGRARERDHVPTHVFQGTAFFPPHSPILKIKCSIHRSCIAINQNSGWRRRHQRKQLPNVSCMRWVHPWIKPSLLGFLGIQIFPKNMSW